MTFALIGAAALVIAGCGDSNSSGGGSAPAASGHAVCKDAESAGAYAEKFFEELSTAIATGKVAADKAQAATERLAKAHADAGAQPMGWYCTQMDEVKKELGI